MLARFSILGFVVGLIAALIIVFVGPEILSFNHARLVYGLIALVVWVFCTLNFRTGYGRREF